MKRLNLATVERILSKTIARAEQEEWPFLQFLYVLLAEEVAHLQESGFSASPAPPTSPS